MSEEVDKLKKILGPKYNHIIDEHFFKNDPNHYIIQFLVEHFSENSQSELILQIMNPASATLESIDFLFKKFQKTPKNQILQFQIYEPFLFTFESKELNDSFSSLLYMIISQNTKECEEITLR
jgi:hypothetical protein